MSQVLQVAFSVLTPLGLLGGLAALGFYAYARRLRHDETRLRALPAGERAAAVDRYLSRYKVRADDLSRAARERLIQDEMDKQFRMSRYYAAVSAIVFVVCFVTAALTYALGRPSGETTGGERTGPEARGGSAGAGSPPESGRAADADSPPESGRAAQSVETLTLSLRRVLLATPSGAEIGGKRFQNPATEALVEEAAAWVKSTLEDQFPRPLEALEVTAGVDLDPEGDAHRLYVLPEDPLRHEHFWMFRQTQVPDQSSKVGHTLSIGEAEEATREAIASAVGRSGGNVLLLHVDRPGYSLRLLKVPLDGEATSATLNRLADPAFTVIVDSIAGSEVVAERLREELRRQGMDAGSPEDFSRKQEAYQKSLGPELSPEQRLVFLREARVDAYITGTYSQGTDP